MPKTANAFARLVSRCDRDAYWDESEHEYVLPHGATKLTCGNAAAPGVQARVLVTRYPRLFSAAAEAVART